MSHSSNFFLSSFGDSKNFVIEKLKILKSLINGGVDVPLDDDIRRLAIQKQEITAKVIAATLTALISLGFTFIGVKWLLNAMDPTKKEKDEAQKRAQSLMKSLGLSNVQLSEYELCIASNLVLPDTMKTEWADIGGLQSTIDEIKETIISPFNHREIFAGTKLVQAPKGILLYGPPGCGKTMIAKATAKAAGARFLNLQLSSLVDKWYGESQKRAEAVFSLARKLQPTIIFIDEIDSFLRERSSQDHEATSMMKTQFMSFWDGLITDDSCQIVVMGATNRPEDVDAAILRRMPSMFHIGLPDKAQREHILHVILKNESISSTVSLTDLACTTEGWSGSDLKELCRCAAVYRVRDLIKLSDREGSEVPTTFGELTNEDFSKAYQRISQSRRVTSAGSLLSKLGGEF